jgi:hypothetical protein
MSKLYVGFSTEDKTVVTGCYPDPQSLDVVPYQDVIDTSDQRWATYYEALPEMMKQFFPAPA